MATLNDHYRNLLDEIPGVNARDFRKAWNREQRIVCQRRRFRELREQVQFTIGPSDVYATATTGLPYSTGTVSGTYDTNVISGTSTVWPAAWVGLSHLQIAITGANPVEIYDVLSVNNGTQQLTVYPKLKKSYSGLEYKIFWVPSYPLSIGTSRDMMGVRWLGRLDGSDRTETIIRNPDEYSLDRVLNYSATERYQMIEMRSENATGDYVLHYYAWPRSIDTMNETIGLSDYVQDIIYCQLLVRYIGRTPMDPNTKGFICAEAKERLARAWSSAISADETLDKNGGVNQATIWNPDRYSTVL